jgi:NADH-quinone oxidoreductase subunit H
MALLNLLVAGAWRFMGESWPRWIISSLVLLTAYVLLGRVLMRKQNLGARSYRYAE